MGSMAWPTWSAPSATPGAFPWRAFLINQFWITFAFSGWNAAVYAAEEFQEPTRDVPRAMVAGTALVAVLYLWVNWVFVANLSPEVAAAVFTHDETKVTLGHLVMEQLLGPVGGVLTSAAMVVVFTSAMSAMTLVGPRVYESMARDHFLPSFLVGKENRPPVAAIVLQGMVASLLVFSHTLLEAVQSIAAVLMVFGGLTAVSVVRLPGSRPVAKVCGALYAAWMAVLLWVGVSSSSKLLVTLVFVLGIGAAAAFVRSRSSF